MAAKTKRAGIYVRISRDRTGEEAGVRRQEQQCRDLAEAKGWTVADVYSDDDRSAYSGKPRPEYERLLADVAAHRLDVIVAWHPDRLTRSPRELEDLIDALDAAKVDVETVRAGRYDLSTRSGRTTARLIGTVARDESEAKAERLQAMHADLAKRGAWKGGTRPYGYQPKRGRLIVDKSEAARIKEAARRVLEGESVPAVCADFNERKIPTVRGARWRPPTMRRMLTSHTVAGRREYKGEDVGPAEWTAILDEVTVRRLRRTINDPSRSRGPIPRVSLLAGIVVCGNVLDNGEVCGTKLGAARRSNNARRIYRCPTRSQGGCGGVQINADRLDQLIADALPVALDEAAVALKLKDARDDGAGDEVAALDEELKLLAGDMGSGLITRAEWLAARVQLEKRRDEAAARASVGGRSALVSSVVAAGPLADQWDDLGLDQQRAIVSALLERVVVKPTDRKGPVFDDDRIDPVWRF